MARGVAVTCRLGVLCDAIRGVRAGMIRFPDLVDTAIHRR